MISSSLLQGVLDSFASPLFIVRDSRILMVNESACNVTSRLADELCGADLNDVLQFEQSLSAQNPTLQNASLLTRGDLSETVSLRSWHTRHEGEDLICIKLIQESDSDSLTETSLQDQLASFRRESAVLRKFGGFFEYNVTDNLYTPSEFQVGVGHGTEENPGFSLEAYLATVHEDDRERVRALALDILENDKPMDILARIKNDRDVYSWIWGMGDFFADSDGKKWLTGLSINVSDLVDEQESLEQKVAQRAAELAESEERYRSMVEDSTDYIAIVNEKREFLYVNRLVMGLKMEEVIGTPIEAFTPPEYHQTAIDSIKQVFDSGKSLVYQIAALGDSGASVWYDCRVSPMFEGEEVVAATIISRDVSEHHERQLEIERLNEELEKQVSEQTKELSSLLDAATQLSTGLDAQPIYSFVTSTITDTLPHLKEAVIWLHDPTNHLLARVASSPSDDGKPPLLPVSDDLKKTLSNFEERLMHHIHYAEKLDMSWAFSSAVEADDVIACMGISMTSFGNSLLVVRGKDPSGGFSDATIRYLKSVVAHASTALSNVDLYEQLKQLSVRSLHTQEEERRRISIELHDHLGGLITSLNMLFENANPSEFSSRAQEILRLLGDSTRDLSSALRPSTLDDFGLVAAVSELIPISNGEGFLEVSFSHNLNDDERFLPSVETVAYRVIQEATTNVLKHSKASSLSISLMKTERELNIQVEDDGIGFDAHEAIRSGKKTLGLEGMKERVALIGGVFDSSSTGEQGTTISASIPTDMDALW